MYEKRNIAGTILLIFLLLLPLVHPLKVEAHSGSVGYSDITIQDRSIQYDLYILADLVGGLLNIDTNQDGYMKENEISQARSNITELVKKGVIVKNNESAGDIRIEDIELTDRWNDSMFHIRMEFQFKEPVTKYIIAYNLFLNGIDMNHQNFATVKAGDSTTEYVLNASNRTIEGQAAGTLNESFHFGDYVWMGMKHIWGGIDHLLFIIGLLFMKASVRDYVKIITAFTVGHSVTLALAALEIMIIPGSIIEPLIALSIMYVAIENIWAIKSGRAPKWRWVVVLLFGFVHGFGFAELLAGKLGGSFIVPLFSFNLGIEIGQLIVLLIALPILTYIGKLHYEQYIGYSASAFVSLCGLYWFITRIFS